MNPLKSMPMSVPSPAVALAVVLFAGTAMAQTEQWLRYHTGPNSRGHRWLELSPTPPPNVTLPKLQPGALYGQWDNALDPNGARWFCLDRSRKTGPHDRLFFDTNGDGRLTDESPITTMRRDERMAWFDPVRLLFPGEDGPIIYHLTARFYQFGENRAQLLIGAGGWYEGHVQIAGKKRHVQLFDYTVNGAFNDTGTSPANSDLILIDGPQGISRHIGRYLELENQLVHVDIARDGAFLKVQPATDVSLATVHVPDTISEFTALGENGHFIRRPQQGQIQLPAGHYRVQGWQIERQDENRQHWTLSGRSIGRPGDFAISPDEPATLALGEPILAVVQAVESRNQIQFDLRLIGSLGESVQILRGNQQPRAPRLEIASADADFRATHTFEYG
jgi:hypothetical protein